MCYFTTMIVVHLCGLPRRLLLYTSFVLFETLHFRSFIFTFITSSNRTVDVYFGRFIDYGYPIVRLPLSHTGRTLAVKFHVIQQTRRVLLPTWRFILDTIMIQPSCHMGPVISASDCRSTCPFGSNPDGNTEDCTLSIHVTVTTDSLFFFFSDFLF